MAKFERTITISQNEDAQLKKWLSEPIDENDHRDNYPSEDETFTKTAVFDNSYEMDIKCCGVQYEDGNTNACWTEAVLFRNGSEVTHSDVGDEFVGEWHLVSDDDEYIVNVIVAN